MHSNDSGLDRMEHICYLCVLEHRNAEQSKLYISILESKENIKAQSLKLPFVHLKVRSVCFEFQHRQAELVLHVQFWLPYRGDGWTGTARVPQSAERDAHAHRDLDVTYASIINASRPFCARDLIWLRSKRCQSE